MTSDRKQTEGTIIAGLDAGTTAVRVVAAQVSAAGLDIKALVSVASAGMRKGVIVDADQTATVIADALAAAREQAKLPIREVIAVLSGGHMQGALTRGGVELQKGRVTGADVERVLESAQQIASVQGREIIHVLPTDFILDGKPGIKDPVGMPGNRLEAKLHVVTASSAPVERLVRACNKAGVQVADLVSHGIASAEAALSAEEKDMGTALVDMGGGTTDIAVYRDGWVIHTAVIPVGGMHFTNDLSVGLRIPFAEAERIKKQFGSVASAAASEDEEIDVVGLDGELRKAEKRLVDDILRLRAEELLELIMQELAHHTEKDSVTGMVFTGGASLIQGFERFAEAAFSMPVRLGLPERAAGSAAPLTALAGMRGMEGLQLLPHAATFGIALYGAMPLLRSGSQAPEEAAPGGRVSGFLKKIFGKR